MKQCERKLNNLNITGNKPSFIIKQRVENQVSIVHRVLFDGGSPLCSFKLIEERAPPNNFAVFLLKMYC